MNNADLVLLKDFVVDEAGNPAHMFWDIRALERSTVLPGVATRDPLDPAFHRERGRYLFNTRQTLTDSIERVTLRVRVRPIALEVLHDLVETGHLESRFLETMPVLDVLPDRCVEPTLRERYPDLVTESSSACDDDADRDFTLVWERDELGADNPSYRSSRVDSLPADCLSHPTYVPTPVE